MENHREKFIKAEERANRLADQLQELKNEAESYQQASAALGSSKDRLLDLIDTIETVVEEERNLIEALEKIGLQEILDRITKSEESIQSEVKSQFEEQDEHLESIESGLSRV